MRSLKLSEWANVAEIIASVVIVASIVYVGLEVNQNTKALQNESYQFVISGLRESNALLLADEDLNRIFEAGVSTPSSLSDEEWRKFSTFMIGRWANWEYLFLMRQEGSISPAAWSAFDPGFRVQVCAPGYLRFFEENRLRHAPEFMEYLDNEVFPDCPGKSEE